MTLLVTNFVTHNFHVWLNVLGREELLDVAAFRDQESFQTLIVREVGSLPP